MNMFSYLEKIDMVLRSDEKLLRLLYYKSTYFSDDPTIETQDRPNILDLPIQDRVKIINHRLKFTPVTKDFADNQICRIIFYASPRSPQRGNYMVARQSVNIDIFVHRDFNDVDMRLSKICDRVNELISNQRVVGIGKATFRGGDPSLLPDEGYVGYSLTYEFGSLS